MIMRLRDSFDRWRFFRSKRSKMVRPSPWLVPALMVFLGLLFLLTSLGGARFLYPYAINGPAIFLRGEWYRLFTGIFLHWNLSHFIMNLISLWLLGTMVENLVGSFRFFVIYMMGGLLGAVLSASLSGPFVHSIGASGAILALLGYLIAVRVASPGSLPRDISRFAVILLIMNLLTNIQGTGLDVLGHLGGFLGGFFSLWVVGLPLHARFALPPEAKTLGMVRGVIVFLLWLAIVLYPIVPHIDLSPRALHRSFHNAADIVSWDSGQQVIASLRDNLRQSIEGLFADDEAGAQRVPHPLSSYNLAQYPGSPGHVESAVRREYSASLMSETLDFRNPFGVASYAQLWTAEVIEAFVQRVAYEEGWDQQRLTRQRQQMLQTLERELAVQVYLFNAGEFGDLSELTKQDEFHVYLETSQGQRAYPAQIRSMEYPDRSPAYTFNEVVFPAAVDGERLVRTDTEWLRLWIDLDGERFFFDFRFAPYRA